jgi:hypothetical protein
VMGADNQQERLSHEATSWFLAGFIEGEGSLVVGIKQHPTTSSGYYVDPGFFLYQHVSGRPLLELAQRMFQSGGIYPKPGNPNVLVFEIASAKVLRERVVPFFERYIVPFTCKRETLERFREVLDMMERREHLKPQGLARIVETAYAMNPNHKGRKRLRSLQEVRERILRDCTPDPPSEVKIQSVPSGD